MLKPSGYDEAQAFTGETEQLPAGAYICEIVKAQEETAKSGAKMLVLVLDIADGEYKGYFRRKYEAMKKTNTNATWLNSGKYRQQTEGKSVSFFKGLIANINNSNPPYDFEKSGFDEKTLTGKYICGVFGREQYKANDGTLKWNTNCSFLTDISWKDNAKIPDDKFYGNTNNNVGANKNTNIDITAAPKFEEIDTEGDLPF